MSNMLLLIYKCLVWWNTLFRLDFNLFHSNRNISLPETRVEADHPRLVLPVGFIKTAADNDGAARQFIPETAQLHLDETAVVGRCCCHSAATP